MFRQPSSRLGLLLNMNKKIGYAVPFASYSHKNGRLECYGLEEFLRILRIPVHSRVSNLATSRRRTLSETASETNPISRQKERVSRPPLPLHSPPHLGNGSRFLPVAFFVAGIATQHSLNPPPLRHVYRLFRLSLEQHFFDIKAF